MKPLYISVGVALLLLLFIFGYSRLYNFGESAGDKKPKLTITPTALEVGTTSLSSKKSNTINTNNTMNNSTQTTPEKRTEVTLNTNKGAITIELFTDIMPITTANFLKLARSGFYDGVKFHRVIDGFMIQGGDPLTKDDTQKVRWGTGGPGYTIPDEFAKDLSNTRGTLSMANAGANTGGSQFFINTADNAFLDGKHPVFGRVIGGMEVVDAISKTKTGANDVPVEAVVILGMNVTE